MRLDAFELVEDPASAIAEIVLDICQLLKTTNQYLGALMDSIQTTQTPEQKRRRHADNVRQLQQNLTDQIRDLNAILETTQNQHPTLDLNGAFVSVHALDSNHRALLDLAKEAAELDAFEIPPPPRLIDHTSSFDANKAGEAPPQPFTHISIDQTDQPEGNNPAMSGMVRKPSPDITAATDATQSQKNEIAVNPGSAPA